VGGDRVADSVQPGRDGGEDAPGVDGAHAAGPCRPVAPKEGRDLGRDGRGRDRNSDDESAVSASR
jgi:hypothetical protein